MSVLIPKKPFIPRSSPLHPAPRILSLDLQLIHQHSSVRAAILLLNRPIEKHVVSVLGVLQLLDLISGVH